MCTQVQVSAKHLGGAPAARGLRLSEIIVQQVVLLQYEQISAAAAAATAPVTPIVSSQLASPSSAAPRNIWLSCQDVRPLSYYCMYVLLFKDI